MAKRRNSTDDEKSYTKKNSSIGYTFYREEKTVTYKYLYGETSNMGWEVDGSKPKSLQALNAKQKGSKESDLKGESKYGISVSDLDKRSTLVKQEKVLLNNDGSIDKRSAAVRDGSVTLNQNGGIRKNSKAVKNGSILLKKK